MQAVIFIGIQATGKTTFYTRQFFHSHVRISMDMLRTRHRESMLLRTCMEVQQPFVVDNTNPSRVERARYIVPAKAAGFQIAGYYFQSKVSDSVRRNEERTGKARIPVKGILGAAGRLELPRLDEGFDSLHYVSIAEDGTFIVQEWQNEI